MRVSDVPAGVGAAPPSAAGKAPTLTLEPGVMLSQYRLVEKIGDGGMGVVYKALDTRLDRLVAVKVLRPEMASDPERLARFEREAKAVAALNHPNISSIHEIDEVDGVTFIVMELIEGRTLRQRIGHKPLPLEAMLDLAVQIADGLDAAHVKGIIHRDIKPANVLITDRGQAKILDFGLAKLTGEEPEPAPEADSNLETALLPDQHLTSPGSTMGTIAYMSPEQVRGEELDARSDLFSFGSLLYEMATGRNAFASATSGLTFDMILNRTPVPVGELNPEAPERIEQIIDKALEKDRRLRYQSAAEMRSDLQRVRRDADSGRIATRRERRPSAGTEPGHPPADAPRIAPWKKLTLIAAALAAIVLVGSAVRQRLARHPTAPASGTIDSVAVLPFENRSEGAEGEYLSDGITENLINSLSRLPDLRVVPRSLVFAYKGKTVDPALAGRELSARAVVTGRVALHGDTLVVSVELIDVANVAQIWGEQYTRTMTDILSVQEEIAREISRNLRLQLSPADERRIARRYTDSTEAYQLYIKSLHQLRKGTKADYERAIEYAKEAIVQDLRQRGSSPGAEGDTQEPGFALAYATLARIYTLQAFLGYVPPREVYPKAKAAARFALEMDDSLGEAHGALAFVRFYHEWDWKAAQEEFARALELSPSDDENHKDHAWFLMAMGRTDEAIAEMQRACALDPLSEEHSAQLAEMYFWAGRLDEAETELKRTVELAPRSAVARLVTAYLDSARGRQKDAIAAYMDYLYVTETESRMSPTLAWFYAAAGRLQEARDILARTKPGEISPTQMAWVHAKLGDIDEAFAWLDKAYEQRAINLLWIETQPWFDPLRSDPRFRALLDRMNLPG